MMNKAIKIITSIAVPALILMPTAVSLAATTPVNSQVTLTQTEIQQGQQRQAQIIQMLHRSSTSSNKGGSGTYNSIGAPAGSNASIGNMTESDNGSTCGPISAWNLLYGVMGSNTPSITTLESDLGWTSSNGTPLSKAWSTTLNNNQSIYNYTVISDPTPQDVFLDTVGTVGFSHIGNVENIIGYLPGYNSVWYLGYTYHYVTGYEYNNYGTNNTSLETETWWDESDINANGHVITNSVSQLQSLAGSGQPGLNFQGVIS